MKNIIKIYSYLISGLLLISSCTDRLNEEDFTYSIASSTFYNTVDEANAAVMAPLDIMRSAYGDNWFATMEINTEYVYPKGVYNGYAYTGVISNTHDTRLNTNWSNFYRAISFCNTAINRLPAASAMTDQQKNQFISELRFLRAINYFTLVKNWGSIPLRTDKNLSQWDLGKSSVKEIYDFIIEDLKFAVEHTPSVARLVGTPSKNAAKALLSEVYLFTENYPEALKLSKEVIDSKSYNLVNISSSKDFDKVFGADLVTSSEEVFYLKTSRTDGRTWGYLAYTSHPQFEIEAGKKMLNGFGYFTHYTDIRNKVVANWKKDDYRYDRNVGFYVFGADAYGSHTALLTKYNDPASSGGGANVSVPLIRYTDVLLTFAEASARVNGAPTAESIETLNKIQRRAYGFSHSEPQPSIDFKLSDYTSMDSFIDLLVKEERYERFNEGKHWNFIVRLKQEQKLVDENYKINGDPTPIAARHYLFKIPDAEFNYNKALDKTKDQNPGY